MQVLHCTHVNNHTTYQDLQFKLSRCLSAPVKAMHDLLLRSKVAAEFAAGKPTDFH